MNNSQVIARQEFVRMQARENAATEAELVAGKYGEEYKKERLQQRIRREIDFVCARIQRS